MVSDSLGCLTGVTGAQCLHTRTVVGRAKPRGLPEFHWVNTVLGHLKRTIAGAHHSLKFDKYADAFSPASDTGSTNASICAHWSHD